MTVCAKNGCRRKATQAWDLRPSWRADTAPKKHYEVCHEHGVEFFNGGVGGFTTDDLSKRIAAELRETL